MRDLHALCLLPLLLAACKSEAPATPDAGDVDAGPPWLGDAGLVVRPPIDKPLHEICGIASNPGDLPLGSDPTSTFLRQGYLNAALDLGGVMIRRDFRWFEIEATKGTLDFTTHDRLVDEAQAKKVRLLGSLLYGTPWATTQPNGDEFFPPDDPAAFGAYARAVASRYAGKVSAWEVWNEPNNGFRFWKTQLSGDPVAYAKLLGIAYGEVHAADPNATVLLGGTVFTGQLIDGAMTFLGKAYDAQPDLAKSFDVAGIHTYPAYPPTRAPEYGEGNDPPLEAKIQMHAWLLAQHGGAGKPMWITELGWPTSGSIDQAVQARFLVRATILAAYAGAGGIFWYTLRDGPHPEAFPPEDAFGLLGNDQDPGVSKEATPKRAYSALKALLAITGERHPLAASAKIEGLPDDARAIRFGGSGAKELVALWTVTTQDAEVTWDEAPASVHDELGVKTGAVATGGKLHVGPDVTYVVME
ncbi:MAG TPA: endo-1,4-beta-xylanase [Polyangiaceae bacterium]